MPILEQQLQAALAATAPAGGVWQDINTAEPPTYPYVVWQIVSSSINNSFAGPSDLQSSRVQVDVYSLSAAERRTLSVAAVAAMLAGPWPSCVQIDSQNLFEDAIRAFRKTMDFSVWSTG
jgi:Protein of unknown function (DUF3168)